MFITRIVNAINIANAVTGVPHAGLKGQLREVVIRELFRPLLPPTLGVGTGEIISASGQTSTQQDVVIYDRGLIAPMALEEQLGLYPVESVTYAIEIKTELTRKELTVAHKSAVELKKLTYLSGQYAPDDTPIPHPVPMVIPALFAFSSGLRPGVALTDVYDKVRGNTAPAIEVFCVVGAGYSYWRPTGWQRWTLTYPLEEVVAFMSGVLNTFPKITEGRHRPRFGHYVI